MRARGERRAAGGERNAKLALDRLHRRDHRPQPHVEEVDVGDGEGDVAVDDDPPVEEPIDQVEQRYLALSPGPLQVRVLALAGCLASPPRSLEGAVPSRGSHLAPGSSPLERLGPT